MYILSTAFQLIDCSHFITVRVRHLQMSRREASLRISFRYII
nr:MAG TPA: hypothetical protein [Caudoviricetes sp.]DAK87632.1 MAG TPA: hypothetical protein [Bacteriophage sp.]